MYTPSIYFYYYFKIEILFFLNSVTKLSHIKENLYEKDSS